MLRFRIIMSCHQNILMYKSISNKYHKTIIKIDDLIYYNSQLTCIKNSIDINEINECKNRLKTFPSIIATNIKIFNNQWRLLLKTIHFLINNKRLFPQMKVIPIKKCVSIIYSNKHLLFYSTRKTIYFIHKMLNRYIQSQYNINNLKRKIKKMVINRKTTIFNILKQKNKKINEDVYNNIYSFI